MDHIEENLKIQLDNFTEKLRENNKLIEQLREKMRIVIQRDTTILSWIRRTLEYIDTETIEGGFICSCNICDRLEQLLDIMENK